ncbi:MAG: DegT/DnrJ/EryC1/StrS family aminotransferase [Acidobacteria bacterium]|nr:DegT/DnrJ/EryC1/StrS family aminotransferase [Acidobacteriota bacterium]
MSTPTVPFLDLRPGDDAVDVRAAIDRVIASGWFVLGPEVEAFEAEFAAASGARFAVGVGNGTDALTLLLRAADIGPGDEVIVPALTAAFSAMAVLAAGARPIFADLDPVRLTLDPGACEAAITPRTRAIMPVHLYGQAADVPALRALADARSLLLIEDCCQAHLATSAGVPVGTSGFGGAFSFYPTKNLGALGDGGAVITSDAAVAERLRRLRNGGQCQRYQHDEPGINSRLDELQAAVLRARLPRLAAQTAHRREIAAAYRRLLPAGLPAVAEVDAGHVYHLFPVRSTDREALQQHLRASGIDTLIHYPLPLTAQRAFASSPAPCPVAARAAREVLSLPMRPGLRDADVAAVAQAAHAFQKGRVHA